MNFDDLTKKKTVRLANGKLRDGDLDVAIRVLETSDVLDTLCLNGNRLTLDDGQLAAAIARSRTLQVLHLSANRIANEGAKRLAGAIKATKTLQEICLTFNEIGDEGAKSLADALAVNKSLQVIGLSGNEIGDKGAQCLAASFEINQTLRMVYLGQNKITDEGAQRLGNALKKNCTIDYLVLDSNSISERVINNIAAIRNDESRMHIRKFIAFIASKDDEIAALKQSLVTRDQQLARNEREIANRDEEIAIRDKEITALKEERSALLKTNESLKNSIRAPFEQLKTILDTVDLTVGEIEPPNKRPRTENAAKSNLAVLNKCNQKVAKVKKEKNVVKATLRSVRKDKEAVEAELTDTRDDLEIYNETLTKQTLVTDILQGRIDEICSLVRSGQADVATVSEIRDRCLSTGH